MRSKEESHDYRYFPEPDLPPLSIPAAWQEEIRQTVPEMPWLRAARFQSAFDLSLEHAEQLTATREVASYFEEAVASGAGASDAASWVMGEVLAAVNNSRSTLAEFPVSPASLAELLGLLRSGRISRPIARQVFAAMLALGGGATEIVEREGLAQVRDTEALEGWVDEVISACRDEVSRFRGGDQKLMGFFVGQVMKLSGGKADPREVSELVRKKLAG
jgi:aspartyl-tRNA(Asn)/glutamyl-tRNA(Gln) amidotransferase subunit B